MGKATIAASLEIVDHGVVVRTVRMHTSWPLPADSLAQWMKPGYWDVDLIGDDRHAMETLCKPRSCDVVEPGHGSNVTFNSLEKVMTIVGPNKRKILLSGTVTISGSAAITYMGAENSYNPNKVTKLTDVTRLVEVSEYTSVRTPSPVAVTSGQQVRITTELTMPRHA